MQTQGNQLAAAYGGAVAIGAVPLDVMLNGLPTFHVAATIFGSLSMLLAGAQVVILSPLGLRDPGIAAGFWRIAGAMRASLLGGVPTAFAAALAHDLGDADLASVRARVCAAALTPVAVSTGVERVTGRPLREVYGMTECAGVICVDPVWTGRVPGSAGLPIPFCEVQARRPGTGGAPYVDACTTGEAGMLVVRGPQVSPGYLGAAPAGESFTADGWLVTGDLGRVDADGRVFITGRAKDLIIRGGHNIDPALIEDALRGHPDVADAAAVGRPDAYAGEVPVAYVVLRPGSDASEEALCTFAAERIAKRAAMPKFIHILGGLPLTAVGKPFKPALRLMAAQAHFQTLLADLPGVRLQVDDEPGQGMLLRLRGVITPPARAGVSERLKAYAVRVAFDDDAPNAVDGDDAGSVAVR